MNWLLFLKLIDSKYEIIQAGSNIVPTDEFDKVLPTTEQIARQPEKVYFDGKKLNLREGEILKTLDELNEGEEINVIKEQQPNVIYDIDEK